MSFNLSLITNPLPYSGEKFAAKPIGLCTPVKGPVNTVPVIINWNGLSSQAFSYSNDSRAVAIDLFALVTGGAPFDAIRSIKIDNSSCNAPVYVQFTDTLDTIICPPNSVVISPVETSGSKCIVYGDGFYKDHSFETTIFLSNAYQEPLLVTAVGTTFKNVWCGANTYNSGGTTSQLFNLPINGLRDLPESLTRFYVVQYVYVATAAGLLAPQSPLANGVAPLSFIQTAGAVPSAVAAGGRGFATGAILIAHPSNTVKSFTLRAVNSFNSAIRGAWMIDNGVNYSSFSDAVATGAGDETTVALPMNMAQGALVLSSFYVARAAAGNFPMQNVNIIEARYNSPANMGFGQIIAPEYGLTTLAPACDGMVGGVAIALY